MMNIDDNIAWNILSSPFQEIVLSGLVSVAINIQEHRLKF